MKVNHILKMHSPSNSKQSNLENSFQRNNNSKRIYQNILRKFFYENVLEFRENFQKKNK